MKRESILVPRILEPPTTTVYGYIYITTNLVNNKKYLGQHYFHSVNVNYLGSGKTLLKAIDKYGTTNFISEPIDWAESKKELDQKEMWWISFLDCVESDDWYNIDIGGTGYKGGKLHPGYGKDGPTKGKPLKPEAKAKMIQALTGRKLTEEHKNNIGKGVKGKLVGDKNPMYGFRFSEEQKQKWSEERRGENNSFYGHHHTEETKDKIRQHLPDQHGENNPNYGHKWSEEKRANNNTARPVIQLSLDGEFIAEFAYMSQTGFYGDYISKCCRGLKESYKGYKWMFKDDYEAMIQQD